MMRWCMKFILLLAITKFSSMSLLWKPIKEIEDEKVNDVKEQEYCMCVPLWQCNENFIGFNEDGVNLLDIRRLLKKSQTSNGCTGHFDVCCKIQCGVRRGEGDGHNVGNDSDGKDEYFDDDLALSARILGENNTAEFSEFPWMLGILQENRYKCGASLIHPQVALTAAHCVDSPRGEYKIRAGEWNWENMDEPLNHQDRSVKKIIIHPNYHGGSLRNDIALTILKHPFKLKPNIGIICLPNIDKQQIYNKKMCIASGWGKNSYRSNNYQSILKKMELPIVPPLKCQRALREARLGSSFILHSSFLCAGGEANKDTCKGDGGSPLVCQIEGDDDGRYEQVGIVSWGLTCGVQSTPGVYVNLIKFKRWIDLQMLKHNFDITLYSY